MRLQLQSVVLLYGMSFSELVLQSGLPWVVISIVCLGSADFSTNCLGKAYRLLIHTVSKQRKKKKRLWALILTNGSLRSKR